LFLFVFCTAYTITVEHGYIPRSWSCTGKKDRVLQG